MQYRNDTEGYPAVDTAVASDMAATDSAATGPATVVAECAKVHP